LLTAGLLLNQGAVVYQKVMIQARADAAARAAAGRQAEDLARLQRTQHLAGELLAWAVLPEALAGRTARGDDLPDADRARGRALRAELLALAEALQSNGLDTPGALALRDPIDSGGTTGLAKLRLLERMSQTYRARRVAGAPPDALEFALIREWRALDGLEAEARACLPAKLDLEERAIPARIEEAARIVGESGAAVEGRVAPLAISGRLVVGVWPGSPRLPVRPEAIDLDAEAPPPDALLIRLAWPWVLHDGRPIRDRLSPLALSDAAAFFDAMTVKATADVAARLYRSVRRPLYEYDRAAAGLLGLAHGRPAPTIATGLFPPPDIGGFLAHAQAIAHDDQPADRRTLVRWT
ncbi:MAG: hypothetical protein K2X91_00975, partial [Thermoleophilia bacterium]|nr:hypothetical protein [Thermoleophilia bacterium]